MGNYFADFSSASGGFAPRHHRGSQTSTGAPPLDPAGLSPNPCCLATPLHSLKPTAKNLRTELNLDVIGNESRALLVTVLSCGLPNTYVKAHISQRKVSS